MKYISYIFLSVLDYPGTPPPPRLSDYFLCVFPTHLIVDRSSVCSVEVDTTGVGDAGVRETGDGDAGVRDTVEEEADGLKV